MLLAVKEFTLLRFKKKLSKNSWLMFWNAALESKGINKDIHVEDAIKLGNKKKTQRELSMVKRLIIICLRNQYPIFKKYLWVTINCLIITYWIIIDLLWKTILIFKSHEMYEICQLNNIENMSRQRPFRTIRPFRLRSLRTLWLSAGSFWSHLGPGRLLKANVQCKGHQISLNSTTR